jgi:hypothetical protein
MVQVYRDGTCIYHQRIPTKPMPLVPLWKGIIHMTLCFPEHKYYRCKHSNQFSDFSKSLMIEFMKSNYYDPYIMQYIHPKESIQSKIKRR